MKHFLLLSSPVSYHWTKDSVNGQGKAKRMLSCSTLDRFTFNFLPTGETWENTTDSCLTHQCLDNEIQTIIQDCPEIKSCAQVGHIPKKALQRLLHRFVLLFFQQINLLFVHFQNERGPVRLPGNCCSTCERKNTAQNTIGFYVCSLPKKFIHINQVDGYSS